MKELKVTLPLEEVGNGARVATKILIELLGLEPHRIVKHPDFIDTVSVENLVSAVIATASKKWFAEGSVAGARAAAEALGSHLAQVTSEGIHGNARS